MVQLSTDKSIGEILRENQMPLALIGIGIAWMVANATGLSERVAEDERVHTARRRIGEITQLSSSQPESSRQILGPSGEPIGSGETRSRNGWVHQAAGTARGAIGSVRDAGSVALDRASSSITGYADGAGDLARRASGQVAEKLERDPWLIGVAGFVGGAILAAFLPLTRTEQEFAAEAQEELRNKATELGHEAAERVRELADSTVRSSQYDPGV